MLQCSVLSGEGVGRVNPNYHLWRLSEPMVT